VFAFDVKTGAETVLYSFCSGGYPCADGALPNPDGRVRRAGARDQAGNARDGRFTLMRLERGKGEHRLLHIDDEKGGVGHGVAAFPHPFALREWGRRIA
jgi:hypothetical protein